MVIRLTFFFFTLTTRYSLHVGVDDLNEWRGRHTLGADPRSGFIGLWLCFRSVLPTRDGPVDVHGVSDTNRLGGNA